VLEACWRRVTCCWLLHRSQVSKMLKNPQLALYLRYVVFLKEAFSTFELVHVSREQNSQADLLSKLASSGKGGR